MIFDHVIDALNWVLEDYTMIAVWGILFIVAVHVAAKTGQKYRYMLALAAIPPMVYFIWARTGLWSSHEYATAFNRSAQVTTVLILLAYLWLKRKNGLYH